MSQEWTTQKTSLRNAEENVIKAKKDLERQTAKLKNKEKLSSSRRNQAEVQSADEGALVRIRSLPSYISISPSFVASFEMFDV